jgi:hypothetical protein
LPFLLFLQLSFLLSSRKDLLLFLPLFVLFNPTQTLKSRWDFGETRPGKQPSEQITEGKPKSAALCFIAQCWPAATNKCRKDEPADAQEPR